MPSELSHILSSVISQATQLPETGIAQNFTRRIGTGNPDTYCILLDTSGSMNHKCRGEETRLDILRQAIATLNWQTSKIFSFNSIVTAIETPNEIEIAGGGTNLARALETIIPLNPCRTIVISDGDPDDENRALAVAEKLTGTISTLFIGDDGDKSAIAFMKKLATLGCGSTSISSLDRGHAQLAQKIDRLILPSSSK
jgi:hypothetical protein